MKWFLAALRVSYKKDLHAVLLGCALALLAVMLRLLYLVHVEHAFLEQTWQQRVTRSQRIPAHRGLIEDCYGYPLAIHQPCCSYYANPQTLDLEDADVQQALAVLGWDKAALQQRFLAHQHRTVVYLKRNVPCQEQDCLQAWKALGIEHEDGHCRAYPAGPLLAPVLGFINVDGQGQWGLEKHLNKRLQGTEGQITYLRDPQGGALSLPMEMDLGTQGQNVRLTLDMPMQARLYPHVVQVCEKHQANSVSVLVVEPSSGKIRAWLSAPSFDPQDRQKQVDGRFRDHASRDAFEPASVQKIFSMLHVLMHGDWPEETVLHNLKPVTFETGVVRDVRPLHTLPLADVLRRSSNIGMARLMWQSAPEKFAQTLYDLGFGQQVLGLDAHEVSGFIPQPSSDPFQQATLSFGYGMHVSLLQLAQAMTVFANEGTLCPLSLIENTYHPPCRQVFDKVHVKRVNEMLHYTVSSLRLGTIPMAGKTGTAKKVGEQGYQDRYRALFAGFAPYENPRYVVVVMVDEPRSHGYYGSIVAAPLFARVVKEIINDMAKSPS